MDNFPSEALTCLILDYQKMQQPWWYRWKLQQNRLDLTPTHAPRYGEPVNVQRAREGIKIRWERLLSSIADEAYDNANRNPRMIGANGMFTTDVGMKILQHFGLPLEVNSWLYFMYLELQSRLAEKPCVWRWGTLHLEMTTIWLTPGDCAPPPLPELRL